MSWCGNLEICINAGRMGKEHWPLAPGDHPSGSDGNGDLVTSGNRASAAMGACACSHTKRPKD